MLARMEQARPLSVVLVEDDPRFRSGLRTLLDGNYNIVGETGSVRTAISLIEWRHPDLVLLDMELEDGDGTEVLLQLTDQQRKTTKFIVLSAHQEGNRIWRAINAGARGYLYKSHVAERLENAITTVMQGYLFLSPEETTSCFQWHQADGFTHPIPAKIPHFSEQEQKVLQWLARGLSNEGIRKKLHLAKGTVKMHIDNIFDKLGVPRRIGIGQDDGKIIKFETDNLFNSRVLAICIAVKLGLVQL